MKSRTIYVYMLAIIVLLKVILMVGLSNQTESANVFLPIGLLDTPRDDYEIVSSNLVVDRYNNFAYDLVYQIKSMKPKISISVVGGFSSLEVDDIVVKRSSTKTDLSSSISDEFLQAEAGNLTLNGYVIRNTQEFEISIDENNSTMILIKGAAIFRPYQDERLLFPIQNMLISKMDQTAFLNEGLVLLSHDADYSLVTKTTPSNFNRIWILWVLTILVLLCLNLLLKKSTRRLERHTFILATFIAVIWYYPNSTMYSVLAVIGMLSCVYLVLVPEDALPENKVTWKFDKKGHLIDE